MNKAILCGNVGSDPRTGQTSSGKAWAQVSLATNERWTDRDGNKQEKTSWHRLKFWGRQAEVVAQYVRKGAKLLVEGRIEYGEYESKETGQMVNTTEIVVFQMQMLGGKRTEEPPAPEDDDDLPF